MNFREWKQLGPEAASRELHRRVGASLPGAQAAAAVAVLVDPAPLAAAFAGADRERPLGGIPCMVKDLYDVAGMPTRGGSSFLQDVRAVPPTESRIVRDLREAGAVIAGKNHLFEFAWGLTGENHFFGDCEHPGFAGRTSGGSSSGSAAVVAAGVVPLAIGTDTGGSIRVPAAFCGLYGYRGVPGDPRIRDAVPLAPSFDTTGWLTRTASDMLEATQALVGLSSLGREPRGCYLEPPDLDPEVAQACRDAALRLTEPADGATRTELLARFAPAAETYGVLAGSESWKLHRRWAERHRARYGPLLQDRLDRAKAVSPAQIAAVEPSQALLKAAWTAFFGTYDFLVMPATPCAALLKADCTHANRLRMLGLTAPASLAGLPVLTLPVALGSGLSTGLQVIVNDPASGVLAWALARAGQSSA